MKSLINHAHECYVPGLKLIVHTERKREFKNLTCCKIIQMKCIHYLEIVLDDTKDIFVIWFMYNYFIN